MGNFDLAFFVTRSSEIKRKKVNYEYVVMIDLTLVQ